ncbi:MAG: thiamine pyrophosphate-dependent dehydrogenase E1 component subunit alpha [Spirochaetia bacterium]|jgi:pyruvate dehydrogenase E1 component alpha subunit
MVSTRSRKAPAVEASHGIPVDTLRSIYTKMAQTRSFEEAAARLFTEGKVHGTAHFCIGEEATGISVCAALQPEDRITATHRGHGQSIGKGMRLDLMMAEFLGKETGYCKGRGGCMHIADFAAGSLGANGIVGGGIPIAVGAALSQRMQGQPNITACFFGDGATSTGSFHESVNLASVWKLPVLFVCVNNLYAMSTPLRKQANISDLALRGQAYGIRSVSMDGNDAVGIYLAAREAREYVREHGPMLLVLNTYRHMGHSKSDANVYRTRQEIEEWKKRCPIKRMREQMISEEVFAAEQLDAIDVQARADVAEAVRFAESSPSPRIEEAARDVFA